MSELSNATMVAPESSGSFPADLSYEATRNAQTLFEWLGSFWSEVYTDPGFIQDLQGARALRVAQLYLDLLESLKLCDRSNAPVFHRERWHPVVLRRSLRNRGAKGMVRLTDEKTASGANLLQLGVQSPEVYPENTVVEIGSDKASYRGMVVYPLDEASAGLKGVLTCACNDIAGATRVLGSGTGFAVLDGAIAIAAEEDPFEGEHRDEWPKFEVLPTVPGGEADEETVLWLCDAMFNRDYIYRHLGYVVALPGGSSELYKRIVNAAWNTVASGGTPLLLTSLVAAICGIPTVKEEGERVERILERDGGDIQVVTDRNVYTYPAGTRLKGDIRPGKTLKRFDTLDQTVHIYTNLHQMADYEADFDEFMTDVPTMDLPPALFRADVEGGFSVGWAEEDVLCAGFFDERETRPKLRFPMGGSEEDDDAFWEDVWASYANSDASMADILENPPERFEAGAVCGRISPMYFFMKNLVGANTIVMTVRTDTLAEDAPLYDPRFFATVRNCVPDYLRLYVIEHESVEVDVYGTDDSTCSDDTDLYAYDECEDRFGNGARARRPKARDWVSSKWIAECCDPDSDD